MAKLTYSVLASLDGFVADERGNFDWAAPDDDVHAFVNDLERGVGTYLYGRGMYEVMAYWETADTEGSDVLADYARLWQSADKVVYSRTLEAAAERAHSVSSGRSIRTPYAPSRTMPRPTSQSEARSSPRPRSQPGSLTSAISSSPRWSWAEGEQALPRGQSLELELLDERRFRGGTVRLHYAIQ